MPSVTLRYSPQRVLLADGRDPATIIAFVTGPEAVATSDIRVRIFSTGGDLSPLPLTIKEGMESGFTILTSKNSGTIAIEYLGSMPQTELEGPRVLNVAFGPPITRLGVRASPPAITLVENSRIVVHLMDEEGRPVNDDKPRKLSFVIDRGKGELETSDVSIPPNDFEAQVMFSPTWIGTATITVSTPNLSTSPVSVHVAFPKLLGLLTLAGGLVGGLLALVSGKSHKWWQTLVGMATGTILYWAFIFGLLDALPKGAVLNPISGFVLPAMGGWLGTEVLSMILKRLGLVK